MGRDFEDATTVAPERLGQDAAYIIDSSKARKELNWQPTISLEEGLAAVTAWIEENWEKIQQQPLEYTHKP